MIKTVKKKSLYDTSSIDPSGQSYLKASNQSSSRIRRRTILGEKFDYGEKIKEFFENRQHFAQGEVWPVSVALNSLYIIISHPYSPLGFGSP